MPLNLKTSYLGLPLRNPLVVGASPMVDSLATVLELEEAGAAAVVMHSLFEEQVVAGEAGAEAHLHSHEEAFAEATSYFPSEVEFTLGPDTYLEQIAKLKERLSIPVVGSLNGRTPGGWTGYAAEIESAGADALELNLYFQPTATEDSAARIEDEAVGIVESVCGSVGLPVAVKLSPFFTSLPHFVRRLSEAGAAAVVVFNRFYQPDIDIEKLETVSSLRLSESDELLLRLRWLAILRDRLPVELACSGGVHAAEDAIKALMAGADVVQLVSCLLREGPGRLAEILRKMTLWFEEFEYASVDEARGSMSYRNTPNPEAIERANYLRILQSWRA